MNLPYYQIYADGNYIIDLRDVSTVRWFNSQYVYLTFKNSPTEITLKYDVALDASNGFTKLEAALTNMQETFTQ